MRAACIVVLTVFAVLLTSVGVLARPFSDLPPGVEVYHIVAGGESLAEIAARYGVAEADLVRANGIRDAQFLRVGQFLRIPPQLSGSAAEPVRYVVQPGDTMGQIAQRYGTTAEALAAANGIFDPSRIWAGQVLTIGPASAPPSALALSFAALQITPKTARQGQTVELLAKVGVEAAVEVYVGGVPLLLIEEPEVRWGLVALPPWAPLGPREVIVTALQPGGWGTRLRCQIQVSATDFPVEVLDLPADRVPLLNPALSAAENERFAQVFGAFAARRMWEEVFLRPVPGEVTSAFGSRRSYVGEDPNSYHSGVDLEGAEGTPVLAANAGRVVLAESTRVRGNAVVLSHGLRLFTAYYHLSRIDVQPGQMVAKGEQIGLLGNTGLSTGPHLHWEMRLNGAPVDAFQWTTQSIP